MEFHLFPNPEFHFSECINILKTMESRWIEILKFFKEENLSEFWKFRQMFRLLLSLKSFNIIQFINHLVSSGNKFLPVSPMIRRQTGISTAIRRTAVRETGASRHHGDPIKGPLKSILHYGIMVPRGLRGPQFCAAKTWVSRMDNKKSFSMDCSTHIIKLIQAELI